MVNACTVAILTIEWPHALEYLIICVNYIPKRKNIPLNTLIGLGHLVLVTMCVSKRCTIDPQPYFPKEHHLHTGG